MRKKSLAGLLTAGILALILNGCGETGEVPADTTEHEEITAESEEKTEAPEKDPIVGTWKTRRDICYSQLDEWLKTYTTCFSPDGQVVHYGHRNVDRGSWERIDENTVVVDFDQCIYKGVGGEEYPLSEYHVTYQFNEGGTSLSRSFQYGRPKYFTARVEKEGKSVYYQASDFDNYEEILWRESDECEIKEGYNTTAVFPNEGEFCIKLEKRLIGIAEDLAEGQEVELEQIDLPYELEQVALYDLTGDGKKEIFAYVSMLPHHPDNYSGATYILTPTDSGIYTILVKNTENIYSELLAPDGTVLLSSSIYGKDGSTSWRGGTRIHLGYREGQVTVEKEESYGFHFDLPLVNKVNDFYSGTYSVYVARNPEEGEGEKYGWYIGIEDSLKIDEEFFQPKLVTFTDFSSDSEYPALYSEWSPFSESWWQGGGRYAEEVEDGASYSYADWVEKAADDRPDEMLRKAVEQSGLVMERKAYSWTAETKKNVTEILRCPVADYYYESDDYAAEYVRGDIVFYKKVLYTSYTGELEEGKQVIWEGTAEEAPPAVCYLDVLEEYERLWKNEKPEEEEAEKAEGGWHTSGKYAGPHFENVLCEAEYYKEHTQLCYSLVDMSGEGICELLIGVRNVENPDDDGFLLTVYTCQSGEITNIQHWSGEEYMGGPIWGLCRGNVLEISYAVAGLGDYCYYSLAPYAAWAEMTETFGYTGHLDSESKEFQYDYYNREKEPISEAEYEELLWRYARVEVEWKALDGFF